jgi:hypothetical protein
MSVIETDGTNRIADYVADIGGFKTQFDVFRFMKRLTEHYGARAFMVLNLPSATSLDLSSNSIITNWPADLIAEYDQVALLASSPILIRLRTATAPFLFDIEHVAKQRDARTTEISKSMFERYRMPRGGYFPVHDASGMRGAVSFAGDRAAFSPTEMMELMYLSIHVYNRLAEIRELDNRATDIAGEIDCPNRRPPARQRRDRRDPRLPAHHQLLSEPRRKKLDTVNRAGVAKR